MKYKYVLPFCLILGKKFVWKEILNKKQETRRGAGVNYSCRYWGGRKSERKSVSALIHGWVVEGNDGGIRRYLGYV